MEMRIEGRHFKVSEAIQNHLEDIEHNRLPVIRQEADFQPELGGRTGVELCQDRPGALRAERRARL